MLVTLHIRICLSFFIICGLAHAQPQKNQYHYHVDLTDVVNDRIKIEVTPPVVKEKQVTFFMPKIIPGTYAIADYGRYVNHFTAYDKHGVKLPVTRTDTNRWDIQQANRLARITYSVDDTWDTSEAGPEIFWPAGTNIEAGKNIVINGSGFFGYLQGKKELPFQITVERPEGWYGSTGLIPEKTGMHAMQVKAETKPSPGDRYDVFHTKDYDELIDSPIMYGAPDTALIKVGNTEVLVSSYSPTRKVTAKEIAKSIRNVLQAQKAYLGGKLPVEKYAFLFYFEDAPLQSYGALEHAYSSFYYMPEMNIAQMEQQLKDFAAHEFFHIVTPLTVHSKEIADFDYNDPDMSKHLWMYEGVTEYFASNVQVKYGLISQREYLDVLREKIIISGQFLDSIPFVDISKYTLDRYHDQYYNVYQKGALIALCLDILLLDQSKGQYGLQNLMLDLSNKYGKNKAFEDEELFSVITEMTYPAVGEFFRKYVAGGQSLPLKEIFEKVGVQYLPERRVQDYSLGISPEHIQVTEWEGKPRLQIVSIQDMNAVGQAMGYAEGDILLEINDESIPDLGQELGPFIQKQMMSLPNRDSLAVTVARQMESGEHKTVRLEAPVIRASIVSRHLLEFVSPTPEQQTLRQAWLEPRKISARF